MKLSIITINYNNAIGLRRTINSVVNQSSTEYEYLVIDGGSIDDSLDIIKEFESKISYYVSEPDSGIYNAMNKGIINSTGDYILFLNSGDLLYSENIISSCIPYFENSDLVYGDLHRIYPEGNKNDIVKFSSKIDFYTFYYGTIAHPSTFINRKLFDKFGLYREDLQIVSDWAFFLKAFSFSNIETIYLSFVVSTFYMDGISSNKSNLLVEERKLVKSDLFSPDLIEILDTHNQYKSFYNKNISKLIQYLSNKVHQIFSKTSWIEYIHKKRYKLLIYLTNSVVRKQLKDPLSIPIIIINYNRLHDLKKLVNQLIKFKHKNIIIIDNNSDYPPLMQYYDSVDHDQITIEKINENYGHLVLWKCVELIEKYCRGYYVVTDSDIYMNESLPSNYILTLKKILDNNRYVTKVGFALDISDIPNSYKLKKKVLKWESKYWTDKISSNVYRSDIDTTFALYPPLYRYNKNNFYDAIRVAGDFTAKHMGWYIDSSQLTDEERYYFKNSNASNSWKLDENNVSVENELYKDTD